MPDQDDGAPPKINGTDYSGVTFEQALFAVTGHGHDLHAVLDKGASGKDGGWFQLADGDNAISAATAGNYHALGTWWYGVNYNKKQFDDWHNRINEIDSLMPSLDKGQLGLMDVQLLRDAKTAVDHYTSSLMSYGATTYGWVSALDSKDSAFRGRAAYAIEGNLERIQFIIDDLQHQLNDRKPSTPSQALGSIADALADFGRGMTSAWVMYRSLYHDSVNTAAKFVMDSIHNYIWGMGLVQGTPNYALDKIGLLEGGDGAKDYVGQVIGTFDSGMNTISKTVGDLDIGVVAHFDQVTPPEGMANISGDLRLQSTWDGINQQISDYARLQLTLPDVFAQKAIAVLSQAYENGKPALVKLKNNKPPTLGAPPGGGGDGGGNFNLNPPPGGGGNVNLNPPPGGGDGGGSVNFTPPPGGGSGGDGGGSVTPPPGGGSGGGNVDFTPPPGGGSGGDGGGNFGGSPPGGNGSGGGNDFTGQGLGGNGAGNTSTPPPWAPNVLTPNGGAGGSANGTAGNDQFPNLEQPFDPNGDGGDEGWQPPGSDSGDNLPPLDRNVPDVPGGDSGGTSNISQPPGVQVPAGGAGGNGGGVGGMSNVKPPPGFDLPGGGLGGGGGSSPGGDFGSGPSSGFGGGGGSSPGGDFGSGLSGGGSGGGDGWADWSGDLGAGNNGGQGFQAPGVKQSGSGMPMMPPMGGMGGMGGGGAGKERERERETWLSEDEEVWGARSAVSSGVVGRPNDEQVTDEPLAPTHVHVRSVAPRERDKKKQRATEATESADAGSSTTT